MAFFLYRLNPPRPRFAAEMTDDERKMMACHGAYWRELLAKGKAVVFGPVSDPKGDWGVAIVEVGDRAEAEGLGAKDPAILSDRGFTLEIHPMPVAILRG